MKTIDGDRLGNMFKYGAYVLDKNRELLNSLNIFPVPDGDTGTNMSLTSMAALKELEKLDTGNSCEVVSAAVANGSLRGARGNSGVILSQLFRGFSKGIKGKNEISTVDFAEALLQSSETAYKAVMKPKEGTVLTVARETAQLAVAIASQVQEFDEFLKQVIARSNAVLKQTTNMLPALKAAGVVDAGGKGLVHIFEGFYEGLTETAPAISTGAGADKQAYSEAMSAAAHKEIKFAYCTEFIIDKDSPTEKTMSTLTGYLEKMGDSIVAVNDEQLIKIHVHTNNPGAVLEYALKIGPLSSIKIENMKFQHTALLSGLQGKDNSVNNNIAETYRANRDIGIISVSAGEGINGIFKELGCDFIIEGGQTMNPSADDIFKAAEKVDKEKLIILPNNKNIILAAVQAARLLEKELEREVKVIGTKTIPQGIGAMVAMVDNRPLAETAEAMEAGANYIKTGQVTVAVRDTEIDGKSVKVGDYLAIIDGEIEAVENSSLAAARKIIAVFARDCELVTIYYSDKALAEEGRELCGYVSEHGLEAEIYYGGQPVYNYIISAE